MRFVTVDVIVESDGTQHPVAGPEPVGETISFATPAEGSYLAGASESPNASGDQNQTFHLGWNIDRFGNPVVEGEPAIYDSWESNWLTGADRWCERHWQYRSADGLTSRRPFTLVIDRATHIPVVTIGGKLVVMNETLDQQRIVVLEADAGVATATIFGDPTAANTIRFGKNNTLAIAQLNAAGLSYVGLTNLDWTDAVVVGGAGNTRIKVQSPGGIVPPLKTTTERDAMTPTLGETIYNTTTLAIESWNGSTWT